MAIILLFFSALFIFLNFLKVAGLRTAFIKSFIATCFFSYLFCEILSLNNALTKTNIGLGWLMVFIAALIYFIKSKGSLEAILNAFKFNPLNPSSPKVSFSSSVLITVLVLVVLPLLLLSVFVPPNNWDSMAYHMPRVLHWIQDKNIYPYPTNIYRQVLTSPLSEYVILNLQILSGTDSFANLVQFFSFVGVLCEVSLLFKLVGINHKGQLFALLMVASLPMIVFQATTTQTDLLATFFFISFVYFTVAIVKEKEKEKEKGNENMIEKKNFFSNTIFLALSLTLGILTKYNVAIFAFPIALYLFIFLCQKINTNLNTKQYSIQVLYFVGISLLIALIVLAPFLSHNMHYFGSITGQGVFDNNASIVSDKLSIKYMLSNNIKQLADFISIPLDPFNKLIHAGVSGFHKILGVSENDPGNNWAGEAFTINNHLNEDTAGSLFHFGFMLVALMLLFKAKITKKYLFGIFYFIFSFSLFSLLFRYSAFNFRLLLPLVTLLIVCCAYIIFKHLENTKWIQLAMISMFFVALLPVYFNRAKPIIADPFYLKRVLSHSPKMLEGSKTIFQRTKMDHYFAQNPSLQSNLVAVFDSLAPAQNKILLETEFDSYEYLAWVLAKEKFGSNFYIGYLPNGKYMSNEANIQPPSFYNSKLKDLKSHWSIVTDK